MSGILQYSGRFPEYCLSGILQYSGHFSDAWDIFQTFSGRTWHFPDIFDNIFRTFIFHRVGFGPGWVESEPKTYKLLKLLAGRIRVVIFFNRNGQTAKHKAWIGSIWFFSTLNGNFIFWNLLMGITFNAWWRHRDLKSHYKMIVKCCVTRYMWIRLFFFELNSYYSQGVTTVMYC